MGESMIATFTHRREAEEAGRAMTGRHPDMSVVVGDEHDAVDALMVNQRAEMGDSAMAGPGGFWSGPMMRGGLVGGVTGFVLGAVLILPILLFVGLPDEDRVLFIVVVMILGGIALSSATFLIGMVRRAQKEDEFTPEDPWAVVRVRPAGGQHWTRESLERIRTELVEQGARSVRALPHEVPRPADGEVERPRVPTGPPAANDWPASQRGANPDSA